MLNKINISLYQSIKLIELLFIHISLDTKNMYILVILIFFFFFLLKNFETWTVSTNSYSYYFYYPEVWPNNLLY